FHPDSTRERPFTLEDGSTRQVPLMARTDDTRYHDGDGFAAVSLPYGEGRFTMDVLLPDEDVSVAQFVERLDPETWADMVDGFEEEEVRLSLPKFTLEYEAELNDVLTALGMGIAFDRNRADFSGLVDLSAIGGNVYISKVKHKTFLEVNEEGSEAAAVTSVEMRLLSGGRIDEPQPIVFTVDRPFVITIRDTETGTLLFIGQITEPGE
ncbi:MAG: serpin family protein, partial [Dehalococcoidia bacterium]